MLVDYLIVGQGIGGTMLSWTLRKAGRSCCVVDRGGTGAASAVAAGVINPVTGRKYVYSWMIDELMPVAVSTYREMEAELGITVLRERTLIDFFPDAEGRGRFLDRLTENDTYLHTYPDQNEFNPHFHYLHGVGAIAPAYTADLPLLLQRWRKELDKAGAFIERPFDHNALEAGRDWVKWEGVTAKKIIFCEGAAGAFNPYFSALPFSLNRGEALILEIPDLPASHLYKRGSLLVPLPGRHQFWAGSTYDWRHPVAQPTEAFRTGMEAKLREWLKPSFTVLDHQAAVRPATVERRPFVGLHPGHPSVGLLNGLGTKGASLAPFFARELVRHLEEGTPLTPGADVGRFERILSRMQG